MDSSLLMQAWTPVSETGSLYLKVKVGLYMFNRLEINFFRENLREIFNFSHSWSPDI